MKTTFSHKIKMAGLAAGLAAAGMAFASVTLNDDGTGFVGKGDVQTAFGWNNKAAQDNAKKVSFSFGEVATYSYVCVWTTGEGTRGEQTHYVTHRTNAAINWDIAYDARLKNQYTGYILKGWGTTTESGDAVPNVGDPCPGFPGNGAVVDSVTEESNSGGLYVTFNGVSVLLPETPTL